MCGCLQDVGVGDLGLGGVQHGGPDVGRVDAGAVLLDQRRLVVRGWSVLRQETPVVGGHVT